MNVFGSFGRDIACSEAELYRRLDAARGGLVAPFDPERLALVSGVGQSILKSGDTFGSPFVKHFAFWIRAAALQGMARNFSARLPPHSHARPRGLVFHLPPQNVETVFLYSWILSYLTGNANVVRLPLEVSPEMRAICDLFLQALDRRSDTSQVFVHYASSSNVSTGVSARSDVRVVWGGDAKVEMFAAVPLRHGGKSIWFGDRFSFSVMNGSELCKLDQAAQAALARRLFNDVFIFDQMACSSPHVVYVVGDETAHLHAVQNLLGELRNEARLRGERPATGHSIRKMVEAFATVASGDATSVSWRDAELTTVVTTRPERREQRVGGGFLRVTFLPSLHDVAPLVREHDQTATYFGFERAEIEAAARETSLLGVSRWVPVGSALDFDSVWDGYDLPFELTSLVRVI